MIVGTDFLYLMALKIAQPARVQDIFDMMVILNENLNLRYFDIEKVKKIHAEMREQRIVFPVKKGVYWLAQAGEDAITDRKLVRRLESNRLFLMKLKRKRR